jgi:hypothetical protein
MSIPNECLAGLWYRHGDLNNLKVFWLGQTGGPGGQFDLSTGVGKGSHIHSSVLNFVLPRALDKNLSKCEPNAHISTEA